MRHRKKRTVSRSTGADLWVLYQSETDNMTPAILNRVLDRQKAKSFLKKRMWQQYYHRTLIQALRQRKSDSRVVHTGFKADYYINKECFIKTLYKLIESRTLSAGNAEKKESLQDRGHPLKKGTIPRAAHGCTLSLLKKMG